MSSPIRSPELTIRPAQRTDLPLLAELERKAAERFLQVPDKTGMTPLQLQDTLDPDELERSLSEHGLWVAEWNTDPAGFIATHAYPGALYIREVDVLPEFGRRGIGRTLIDLAVEHAARNGLPTVLLRTFREVEWNAPFYRKLGFRPVEHSGQPDFMNEIVDREAEWGLDPEKRLFMALGGHLEWLGEKR